MDKAIFDLSIIKSGEKIDTEKKPGDAEDSNSNTLLLNENNELKEELKKLKLEIE